MVGQLTCVISGDDFDKVWHEHCNNKDCLEEYAISMLDLATEVWDKDCDGTHRIQVFSTSFSTIEMVLYLVASYFLKVLLEQRIRFC